MQITIILFLQLHGRAFLAQSAYTELTSVCGQVSPALADVLKVVLELYLIDACLNRLGDFLRVCIRTNSNCS